MRGEDCWAKTDEEGRPALTVRDHCVIVGMVAEAAGRLLPPTVRGLLPEGGATLTAAHDIGKLTPGFQAKCAHNSCAGLAGIATVESNHAKVSQAFLASVMRDAGGAPLFWTLAADGHHGSYHASEPRDNLGRRGGILEGPWSWPAELRQLLLQELTEVFGALPGVQVLAGPELHWMTGFVTFCDWIGSNTDWFPMHPGEVLRHRVVAGDARRQAVEVVKDLGWHRREVKPGLEFGTLFQVRPHEQPMRPRPLQARLVEIADAPGLYIVEAPMGLGKTEAALAAAYRRWTEGEERGLYFALPTQLTSNRIHDRVASFLRNVVADEGTVQALVHGAAWLREDRIRAFSPSASGSEPGADARDSCQWFAGSRRPLLAPFGTGTIDQALMARIAARHSALRLFALSGKIVVIDEVHSYDPYTAKLVDGLVDWLLRTGCTVLILSATLTARRRARWNRCRCPPPILCSPR